MTLRLYDSKTRAFHELQTIEPGKVSIYHCGLTVQAAPHLGHIRKEVVFDVLRRWLTASGYEVTIVANVTDIDDKILAVSAARGVPWFAHAYQFERELHAAYTALGCLSPTYEPRATGHIPEMLELVGELIERGHAYVAGDGSGDVYFDVKSWPSYGELSHQAIDDMAPAEDSDPRGKRDPRDFALWKGHKEGEPITASWPSLWGRGRPGWHLECSAMAGKYLGDAFDIHGGGIDLRFPHHENELAQSKAAGRPFATYWMHNAWVTAAGEKMSKSLSNGALVSEVTKQFPPRAVRFYLAQPHYRSAVEYSETSLTEATASLARIDSFLERASEALGEPIAPLPPVTAGDVPAAFAEAMNDDLGTPTAVATVYGSVRDGNTALAAGDLEGVRTAWREARAMLSVLGLDPADPAWAGQTSDEQALRPVVDGLVQALLDQRADARARKDYAAADAIRDKLTALGLTITDTPQGPAGACDAGELVAPRRSYVGQGHWIEGPDGRLGGRVRRGLEGKGPTPKAEDRVYHKAYRAKQAAAKRPGGGQGGQGREKRTGRPGAGPEWVVGRNPVLEALQAGLPVKTAYVADGAERDDRLREILKVAAETSMPLLQVTRAELDRLTGGAVHQGVAVQLPAYEYAHPDDLLEEALDADRPLVVALDSITDPRNLGAIVRSAAAFGAQGVVIPERRSAAMTAAAWKTSAGAAARIPVARATNLVRTMSAYADAGFTVIGLAGEGDEDFDDIDLDGPVLLVVGAEGDGLSHLVKKTCDHLVRIPIASDVESLNAGVAAGIGLYEITRGI